MQSTSPAGLFYLRKTREEEVRRMSVPPREKPGGPI